MFPRKAKALAVTTGGIGEWLDQLVVLPWLPSLRHGTLRRWRTQLHLGSSLLGCYLESSG